MSHKSRICAVLVDVEAGAYEASATFWGQALGRKIQFDPNARYTDLRGDLDVLIQRTDAAHAGMHIDIETDDVEAEATRLERLGARKRGKIKEWWVMEAPGGQAFCVVPAHSRSWPVGAVTWEE